jgi:two-component system, NarL family, nitrate/nitrite response regulator NarL
MNLLIFAGVRLVSESLAACLDGHRGIDRVEIASTAAAVRTLLLQSEFDVVLIDCSTPDDAMVRALALEFPQVKLLALGLEEQRDSVIHCGRAGFSGYVPRDAGLDALREAVLDCGCGRLRCTAEIASSMMKALFFDRAPPAKPAEPEATESLTGRQKQVTQLISRGYSNKEIARELKLSVATVKHHVHHVLAKLQVTRRSCVVQRLRGGDTLTPSEPSFRRRGSRS